MKKIMLILFFSAAVFSQNAGFVEVDHPVNRFLERMVNRGILSELDIQHKPFTINKVAESLKEISKHSTDLSVSDNELLSEFLSEYSFALQNDVSSFYSFADEPSIKQLFSEKDKYIYFSADSTGSGVFVNFLFNTEYTGLRQSSENANVTTAKWGGKISGSFGDNFGFSIKATNGSSFGNKDVLLLDPKYQSNYKFAETEEKNVGSNYFDETEGYAAYFNDNLTVKIGRDKNLVGYGNNKTILSRNSLSMDFMSLDYNYRSFNFSYLHGKLLGSQSVNPDSTEGASINVAEKYFVYHRFGLNLSRYFNLGAGEMIIYSRRGLDLSYLNPFNFYKSIEHDNRDRDNSILFFDFLSYPTKGIKLFGEYIIDDIDFSKIGTGWYGNKTLLNLGIDYTAGLYSIVPVDLSFQCVRIEPYVYSHRLTDNNYTTLGISLANPLQPNSMNYFTSAYYQFTGRLNIEAVYSYSIHGENVFDENGNLRINYGGDLNKGHRVSDSESISFLEGIKSYTNGLSLKTEYQFIRNYYISMYVNYNSVKKGSAVSSMVVYKLLLSVKI